MEWFTKLDNGLWKDNRTGEIGVLKKGRGHGWYVDENDTNPMGKRENYFKSKHINNYEINTNEIIYGKNEADKLYKRAKNELEWNKAEERQKLWENMYSTRKEDEQYWEDYDNSKEYTEDISNLEGKHIAGREAKAREIDKINNSNKHITENEQKDELSDTSPMSEWSDTTGTGYSDKQYKEIQNRIKNNKIVDSFGNNVVYQNEKGNWVNSRENYNNYVNGKTDKLGGELVLNEKQAREALAGYDALEKVPYENNDENTKKWLKQKQENLDKMYKTIGYDDSKYNYDFKEKAKVTLPDGTPIDQNYIKDIYSGMSYDEVKRENDFDKEWIKNVKPEAKAMQMAKVEETDKYLANMEKYESRINDEEYGKKDWGDNVYPFSEGSAWKGTKSGERLSTKEIAKAVTDKMKEAYPGVKIGRNTSYYSGGSSADFSIMSSDKPLVRDISDFSDSEISRLYNKGYNSNWYKSEAEYKEHLAKELSSGHFDINQYYIDDDHRLTPYGKQVIKDLKKVSDAYNYDESDGMTDYFNRGFYSDISIGKYNKPYETTTSVSKSKVNNTKAKIERFNQRKQGSTYDTMSKRQLAEKIVEDQLSRGLKFNDKESIIQSKMKMSKSELLKYFK